MDSVICDSSMWYCFWFWFINLGFSEVYNPIDNIQIAFKQFYVFELLCFISIDFSCKSDDIENWSSLLFDQAMLAEGGALEDPAGFVKRQNEMMLALLMRAS